MNLPIFDSEQHDIEYDEGLEQIRFNPEDNLMYVLDITKEDMFHQSFEEVHYDDDEPYTLETLDSFNPYKGHDQYEQKLYISDWHPTEHELYSVMLNNETKVTELK